MRSYRTNGFVRYGLMIAQPYMAVSADLMSKHETRDSLIYWLTIISERNILAVTKFVFI